MKAFSMSLTYTILKFKYNIEYHRHDQRHRKDGPAVTFRDSHQEWRLHGMVHRIDGPAIISPDGMRRYYIYGKLCSRMQFNKNKNKNLKSV